MVVDRAVEVLAVGSVLVVVVFGALDVEVGDPAEFTVEVALTGDLGVVGHSRSFDLVHLVGVQFSLGLDELELGLSGLLVEELLEVSVVG